MITLLKSLLKFSHPARMGPISTLTMTGTLFFSVFSSPILHEGCSAKAFLVLHGPKESMGCHSITLNDLLRLGALELGKT